MQNYDTAISMSIAIYCDERVFKGPVAEGGGMSEKGLKRLRVRRF